MKKIFILLFTAIFVFLLFSAKAQSDQLNMKKYWWYHYRLLNDFMAKGDCKGCSEAMNQRAYRHIIGTTSTPESLTNFAKWGDQTISLGMYLGVLATEYRLLKMHGQPVDTTIQELYYALKAFNRLDESAEHYMFSPHVTAPPDLNGFFIRDDVDGNFLLEHPKLAHGVTSEYEAELVESDTHSGNPSLSSNEMSHDQVWHLFMGFALVQKFVDDISYNGLPLNNLTGNSNIRQEARDITDRIMHHITSTGWIIQNPMFGTPVARGQNVIALSYGAAEAACYIKDNSTSQDYSMPIYPINTCKDYHDWISYADALPWNELGKPPGAGYAFTDEDYKVDVLASIGHSWYSNMYPVIPNPMTTIIALFDPENWRHPFQFIVQTLTLPPVLPVNVTATELGVRASLRDWQHLPLLHQVLHGGSNIILENTYKQLLNSAPCNGPYNLGYPDNSAPFEWSTDNRMLSPDRRGDFTMEINDHEVGEDKVGTFHGEYNGLDYMIYYNLFAISQGGSPGSGVNYTNYMDRTVTTPFPIGTIGTASSPVTIEGFNSIYASNTINSTADVSYRAGNQIHLAPGFHTNSGATFHAYIDPFSCATDGEYRSTPTADDDNHVGMQNAVAYAGQTTFIKYPVSEQLAADNRVNDEQQEGQQAVATNENLNLNPVSTTPVFPSGIAIYPNPNNGSFTVSVQANGQNTFNAKLTVSTVLGKTVLEQQITNASTIIDISSQSKGIYYVKIEGKDGIKMEKIIYQ